jgi:pilus assembly protein CpaE
VKLFAALCSPEQIDALTDLVKANVSSQITVATNYAQFIQKSEGEYDSIVVHCDLFPHVYPWDWMVDLQTRHPLAKVTVVLSSQTYDSIFNDVIIRIAADCDFRIIPLGLSEQEVAEKLAEDLFGAQPRSPNKKGRLITVMSASSKDGATTVAVNLALSLAKSTHLTIGLLDLNLKSPDVKDNININNAGKSLFSLRPKYSANVVTSKDILDHCYGYRGFKNLKFLLGSHRRDTAGDLTFEQMKFLLDAAQQAFDIVIADVHTFPDNAATVYAIKHANERLLVAQPNYMSFKSSWADWYDCFWRHCGLEKSDFSLVVNRSSPSSEIKPSGMEADLGIKLLGVISNISGGVGIRSVNEGIPLLLADNNGTFPKEMHTIAAKLTNRMGAAAVMNNKEPGHNPSRLSKVLAMMLAKLE